MGSTAPPLKTRLHNTQVRDVSHAKQKRELFRVIESWRKLLLLAAAGTHSQFFTGVPLPQNTLL